MVDENDDEGERPAVNANWSAVIITDGAEEWIECAARVFAGTPKDFKVDADWADHIDIDKVTRRMSKTELSTLCSKTRHCTPVDGAKSSKAEYAEALMRTFSGPSLPRGGVHICHPGFAVGYDTEMRNPAWTAYRLKTSEQRAVDNSRKTFILDPSLLKAGVAQTAQAEYTNTNFDKGHLAPSLAMSFNRKYLQGIDRSPWRSSYYCSNIAPQCDVLNQRAWQTMEDAMQDFSSDAARKDDDVVYVVTGVSYWNRDQPRRWSGQLGECWLFCPPCGKECGCVECPPGEYVNVPTFYWKVACNPEKGGAEVVIAENDPESNHIGEDEGWPSSIFEDYTPRELERFFGIDLNLPAECTKKKTLDGFDIDWRGDKQPPPQVPTKEHRIGKFQMNIVGIGGQRVILGEQIWLHFTFPFGAAGDKHRTLVIAPPIDHVQSDKEDAIWQADCSNIFAHNLPPVKKCEVGKDTRLTFDGPIKGGTFVFSMLMTAPKVPPPPEAFWSASMIGGRNFKPTLVNPGFQLVRSLSKAWENRWKRWNSGKKKPSTKKPSTKGTKTTPTTTRKPQPSGSRRRSARGSDVSESEEPWLEVDPQYMEDLWSSDDDAEWVPPR